MELTAQSGHSGLTYQELLINRLYLSVDEIEP